MPVRLIAKKSFQASLNGAEILSFKEGEEFTAPDALADSLIKAKKAELAPEPELEDESSEEEEASEEGQEGEEGSEEGEAEQGSKAEGAAPENKAKTKKKKPSARRG